MWVVEQAGSRPKYGAAPGNRPSAAGPRREPAAVVRTEAEAGEHLRHLQRWAPAGVDSPATRPSSRPTGSGLPTPPPRRGGRTGRPR